MHRRLGGKSVAAPTGKSFRFVRACDARCLDVKRNPSEILMRPAFPFSLLAVGGFPFSLGIPPPPNLLSSFSWPYGYIYIYRDIQGYIPLYTIIYHYISLYIILYIIIYHIISYYISLYIILYHKIYNYISLYIIISYNMILC